MGTEKGLVSYKGRPMIAYSIDVCRAFSTDIRISTGNSQYEKFGYPLVPDPVKDIGPIGGLAAALEDSPTAGILVCPCDMPELRAEIFQKILQVRHGAKAVVAANPAGKAFPVTGYYHKSALSIILGQIAIKNYSLQPLVSLLDARKVTVEQSWLVNINSMDDLI